MLNITSADVTKLARLANLTIDKESSKSLSRQLSESLNYVHNLEDIDTSAVPGSYFTTSAKNVMDEDEMDESVMLSQEEALKNAQNVKDGYFVVKRIL